MKIQGQIANTMTQTNTKPYLCRYTRPTTVRHPVTTSRRPWQSHIVAACAVLLLIASGHAGFAQAGNTTSVAGVDVTLALNKTSISVGEPLILNIIMENVTEAPVVDLLANFQLPEGNDIEVNVQPPGELEYQYTGGLDSGTYPGVPLKLTGHSPKSIDTLLLYDRTQPTGLLFSKPGTYQMTVKFQFRLGGSNNISTAALPPTQVTVVAADTADQEVLALFDEPDYIRVLQLGVIPTTAAVTIIEDAAKRYPSTALGSLAMRALGNHFARGLGNDVERGADLLQQFLKAGVVPVDQDGAVWSIMTARHTNKNYDLAREWAFYMIRNYGDSVRVRPEDVLLHYYYFAPAQFAAEVPWYLLKSPWILPGVEPPTNLTPLQGK